MLEKIIEIDIIFFNKILIMLWLQAIQSLKMADYVRYDFKRNKHVTARSLYISSN